jgi:hypothetical protein
MYAKSLLFRIVTDSITPRPSSFATAKRSSRFTAMMAGSVVVSHTRIVESTTGRRAVSDGRVIGRPANNPPW